MNSVLFFFQTFSLLWPSAVCFDLYQNTRDPRWRWEGPQKVEKYYLAIGAAISVVAPLSITFGPAIDDGKGDDSCSVRAATYFLLIKKVLIFSHPLCMFRRLKNSRPRAPFLASCSTLSFLSWLSSSISA